MGLFNQKTLPQPETWDALREWAARPWLERYMASFSVMARFTSIVMLLSGIALMFAEPSWRTVRLIAFLWIIGVPVTALGYMRKHDRLARNIPRDQLNSN